MRKVLKAVKYLVVGLYVAGGVLLAVFLLPRTGWKALSVQTGSMNPALPQGSLVVVHDVSYGSIRAEDVITFVNPQDARQTITHRVVEARTVSGLPGFVTKGDANKDADTPILDGNVVGKVVWQVPMVGRWLDTLKQPLWIVLLVAVPGLLIIIDELRLLVLTLARQEREREQRSAGAVAQPAGSRGTAGAKPGRPAPAPARPRRLDGLLRMALIAAVTALAVGNTRAALTTTATLTNNTIQSAATADHVLINKITLGSEASNNNSCSGTGDSVTISNTVPGSNNQATVTNHCTITGGGSTNVSVNTSSNQTATSGSQSNTNNTTTTTNVVTGGASNTTTSSSSISVTTNGNMTSTTVGGSAAAIELYNPTGTSVHVAGWRLRAGTVVQSIPEGDIPAHGTMTVSFTVRALAAAGDELRLEGEAGAVLDAVSWGTNTSQLNPAAPAMTAARQLRRTAVGYDSDTATDWVATP